VDVAVGGRPGGRRHDGSWCAEVGFADDEPNDGASGPFQRPGRFHHLDDAERLDCGHARRYAGIGHRHMVPLMTDIDVTATDRLLTTTRSVRRRLDFSRPVPLPLVEECLEVALQAPTGGNLQLWRWLIVTDAGQRARIAELYRQAWNVYKAAAADRHYEDADPRGRQIGAVVDSAQYLADHLHEVPAFVIPCVPMRSETADLMTAATLLASVLPATWSFMLAARARGLGTTLTTLTLMHERKVAAILELPEGVTHCALVPVAYYTGDSFRPVTRLPLREVTFHDRWQQPLAD
jgi:nitroreductase